MKNILRISLLIFVFQIHSLQAQQVLSIPSGERPLREILSEIERQGAVSFSYDAELISKVALNLEKAEGSLSEILKKIEEASGLRFVKLSEVLIAIRGPEKTQAFCGTVKDGTTGAPLPFATVRSLRLAQGTTTDDTGSFYWKDWKPGDTLDISFIGYQDRRIVLSETTENRCMDIFLAQGTVALEEVVVEAYLVKGMSKNTDGSVTLRKDELGLLPGLAEPDVFQSLQLIPGINSPDESAIGLQIRGGSPDQNLILYDGIKLYNAGHFFGLISSLNPYTVEEVRVFKGGADVEYGDRVSGVIDMTTLIRIPDSVHGGIGINGTNADAWIKTPLGSQTALNLSARRSYADIWQSPTITALSNKIFQNTTIQTSDDDEGDLDEVDEDELTTLEGTESFTFYDLSGSALWQPSSTDRLKLSALYTRNDLDFNLQDDEDLNRDTFLVENQGVSLHWASSIGPRWRYEVEAYMTEMNSSYDNLFTEEEDLFQQSNRENRVQEWGVKAEGSYRLNDEQRIRLGYEGVQTEVLFSLFRLRSGEDEDNPGVVDILREGSNFTHSLYSAWEWRPANKAYIHAGARLSQYEVVSGIYVEPRLFAEFPLSRHLRLKASAEQRYQSISQLVEFDDIRFRLENQIWTLSNGDDLPLLESKQVSAGWLLSAGGWTWEVDGYYRALNGLTSLTSGYLTGVQQLSTGESTILGADVLLRKKWDPLTLWLGYTFQDVEYLFEEIQLTPFPGNNDITHNLRLSASVDLGRWELSAGGWYRTGSPFTNVVSFNSTTNEISFSDLNGDRLPSYHRADLSLRYRLPFLDSGWRGILGLSVQNIYDRRIPLSINYRIDRDPQTGENRLTRIEQLSQGLTPNFVVRIEF